jgi:hypothetical protein
MANDIRLQIKQAFPRPLWQWMNNMRYALQRAVQIPSATFHPLRQESIKRLKLYQNKFQGQRCFIIGNGPSLKNTDLSKLKGEYSFGLNRIYLLFPELSFSTTFLVVVNDLVIEQFAPAMLALPIPKFFSWHSRRLFQIPPSLPKEQHPVFLHTTYTGLKFAHNVRGRLWEGATVTYIALQLAFYMGFEKVILVGVDHNFTTQGKANTTVVSQGDDPNHFAPQYFGKGVRWQLPDLEASERAYTIARETYQKAGRVILDATVGGKLQVFPKVNYDDVL